MKRKSKAEVAALVKKFRDITEKIRKVEGKGFGCEEIVYSCFLRIKDCDCASDSRICRLCKKTGIGFKTGEE